MYLWALNKPTFKDVNSIFRNVIEADCKTVRIFAYSSTHEQSNKRSGTRLKTNTLTPHFTFFLLILRKKPTVLQSMNKGKIFPFFHRS